MYKDVSDFEKSLLIKGLLLGMLYQHWAERYKN